MTPASLDPIDMGILYLLQENARDNTTKAIGDQLDVAASTVGNRIRKLENEGVIEGYNPNINYERSGFDHHHVVTCTVPFDECDRYIEEIFDEVTGVVNVRKFFTATENLSLEMVCVDKAAFEACIRDLKALDIDVVEFELIDREVSRPFGQFGSETITTDVDH